MVAEDQSPYLNCGEDPVVLQELVGESRFQRWFGAGNRLIQFDTAKYPFREGVENRLRELGHWQDGTRLENLHEILPDELIAMDASGQPPVAVAFYDAGDELMTIYRDFLRDVVHDAIEGEPFYFQETPTFRFSFPGSPGYSWRPNYHTDIAIGHPPCEINFWFSATECLPQNSLIYGDLEESLEIWRDFDFDFRDFHARLDADDALQERCEAATKPLRCGYGDVLMFDSRCMHLHQRNRTDQTRVSVDFRIVPVSDGDKLSRGYLGTGRRKARFEPGGYYAAMSSEAL